MTDKQLYEGQEIKRVLASLNEALDQFKFRNSNGLSLYLPNNDKVCAAVKKTLTSLVEEFNTMFKNL